MEALQHACKKSLAAVAVLLAGAVAAGCNDPPVPPRVSGQVHLTLLQTADIHSRLYPYNLQLGEVDAGLGLGATSAIVNVGGAARVSYVVGRERARAQRVLHLDCGDSFQGAPVFNFYNGEPEIRTLSAMGTDVSLVANHEFDHGALNLGIQLQKWATFPALAANYQFDDPSIPGASPLGGIVKPFTVMDLDGLRVGVIGMGNLSSLTSIFNMPNRLGITPLNTTETAQFYVDLLRPQVDVIVVLSHLGLDVDENLIQTTEGIDVVLGSHNHIVLQPPKQVPDCSAYPPDVMPDGTSKSYILLDGASSGQAGVGCKHNADCGENAICFGDTLSIQAGNGICKQKRYCSPRNVLLSHSGAFAKYVGRLDLLFTNTTTDLPADYDPKNGFELLTNDYELFPITEQTPEDPVVASLLEPYRQGLDAVGNLELLVGYALDGSKRVATGGGDSPLGNMISTAMWLRLGIQTDFALTNTTGIRTDLVPGPVTVEQMYNIFPFDNTITKMDLSGVEVQQLFDFVALRSAGRGCVSQVQIAGARVVLDCTKVGPFSESQGNPGVATHIYIGGYSPNKKCNSDADCPGAGPNSCDTVAKVCFQPIDPVATYELATSNYLAGGGSGFLVLKHNTTQNNTGVEQRDALIDYMRAGLPCGADQTTGKLPTCSKDNDCPENFVCACPEAVEDDVVQCKTTPMGCGGKGSCVLQQCRDDVAAFQRATCQAAPTGMIQQQCETDLSPCVAGGETCKYLACIDKYLGNYSDARVTMVGQ